MEQWCSRPRYGLRYTVWQFNTRLLLLLPPQHKRTLLREVTSERPERERGNFNPSRVRIPLYIKINRYLFRIRLSILYIVIVMGLVNNKYHLKYPLSSNLILQKSGIYYNVSSVCELWLHTKPRTKEGVVWVKTWPSRAAHRRLCEQHLPRHWMWLFNIKTSDGIRMRNMYFRTHVWIRV